MKSRKRPSAQLTEREHIMELKFKGEKAVVGTTIVDGILYVGVKGFPVMKVVPGEMSEGVRSMAVLNGLRQRLMDAAAIKRDTTTGLSVSPAEKDAAIRKLFDHYMGGADTWELQRGAVGPRMDPLVVRAICEAFGKSEEVVRGMIEAKAAEKGLKPAEYCAAMAGVGKVKPIVERLRAEALAGVEVEDDPFAEEPGEE